MKVRWGAPNLSESESEDDSEEVFDGNVNNNDDWLWLIVVYNECKVYKEQ